jgi:hypothetical protein
MNKILSELNNEALEYLLIRMVAAHKNQLLSETDYTDIRMMLHRTSTGIKFMDGYQVNGFIITGGYIQNDVPILVASKGNTPRDDVIYIDMTDFLDCDEFDIDHLTLKLEEQFNCLAEFY